MALWYRDLSPHVLVAGDEDDLPAIREVVASLPEDAYGHVFIEVPSAYPRTALLSPSRLAVTWLDRSTRFGSLQALVFANRGEALARALAGWATEWLACDDDLEDAQLVWLGAEGNTAVGLVRDIFFATACLSVHPLNGHPAGPARPALHSLHEPGPHPGI